ncbi:MAG TPA: ABC transporter permease, partial [Gemmatimonadales bacterium]|nr:ABC transporter permease [Gemmatimonadales bacterium]
GLLSLALVIFITANLAVGYTFSTIAQNQLQAMQMTTFFLLPNILLTGFAFPFLGMPGWARAIGNVLPATHLLRIVRGVMLKANGLPEIWPDLWPLALFNLTVGVIALLRFRRTLD